MDKDRATLMEIQDKQAKDNKDIAPLKEAKAILIAKVKEPVRVKEAKLSAKPQIKNPKDHLQVQAKDILDRATTTIQTMPKAHQAQIKNPKDLLQVQAKDILDRAKVTIQTMPKVHQAQTRNRAKVHSNSSNNKAPVRVLHNRKRALKRRTIM